MGKNKQKTQKPTDSSSRFDELASIQSIFNQFKTVPYCTGTVPLDTNASTIFYRSGDFDSKIDFIDFAHPTDEQLKNLADACQPATFGMNQKDVYDESYRKAGKMDVDRFASQFHPANHGILEVLSDVLLRGKSDMRSIRMELYKLNVYGPGGFFKAHVDTPRGATMFGSLVVILPTIHEGGGLILRQGGKEWTVNSANTVRPSQPEVGPSKAPNPAPHAAFVAFFSDVEHEVTTISSGYRVTLTYNLYLKPSTTASNPVYNEAESQLREHLVRLLKDSKFLPNGGTLGFGLDHKYPINPRQSTDLEDLGKCLKGMDESIKRVCESLSLKISLKAVYRVPWNTYSKTSGSAAIVLDNFAEFGTLTEIETSTDLIMHLSSLTGARVLCNPGQRKQNIPQEFRETTEPIIWIKELSETNAFADAYIGYGNEAELEYAYGEVCLVSEVRPAKMRL